MRRLTATPFRLSASYADVPSAKSSEAAEDTKFEMNKNLNFGYGLSVGAAAEID